MKLQVIRDCLFLSAMICIFIFLLFIPTFEPISFSFSLLFTIIGLAIDKELNENNHKD